MGGMERASVNLANQFANLNHQVQYIAIVKRKPFFNLNPNIIFNQPDVEVKKLPILSTLRRIRKQIQSFNPDKVIGFNKYYSALTAIALLGLNKPLYISERSSPLYKWDKKISLFCKLAFALKIPKAVVAQTNIAKTFQKKYYIKSNIVVIPNMVDLNSFKCGKKEKIILAVGRINDYLKGFDLLVQAIHLCNNNWPIYIAGGDETDEAFVMLINQFGLQRRFVLLGKVEDIKCWYSKAEIFVIPSRSEGFPNALIEAMAGACACVTFDFIAGPQDIILHEENGILVESENVQLLANAIDKLTYDDLLRDKIQNAALNSVQKYSSAIITQSWLNLLEDTR
jgi:GalNAc-alpha-(1->4)-GalNAc-alpha-(1->3)-diNAcBac-PP-undecaprenol alpha-1,4-N-acetyl-D-galactosaminyltransferase